MPHMNLVFVFSFIAIIIFASVYYFSRIIINQIPCNNYFLMLCEVKTRQLRHSSCLLLADIQEDVTIVSFKTIGVFKESFSHEAFNFGDLDRFTFKVNVFDIKGFISLKVSAV